MGVSRGVYQVPGHPPLFRLHFFRELEIIVETARGAWRPPALVHQMRIFLIYKLRGLPLVLPFGPQPMGGYILLKGGMCPDFKKMHQVAGRLVQAEVDKNIKIALIGGFMAVMSWVIFGLSFFLRGIKVFTVGCNLKRLSLAPVCLTTAAERRDSHKNASSTRIQLRLVIGSTRIRQDGVRGKSERRGTNSSVGGSTLSL